MKRRTLDLMVSGGLFVLAGLLLVAGLVLTSNANFANTYVTDQLSAAEDHVQAGRGADRRGEGAGVPGRRTPGRS